MVWLPHVFSRLPVYPPLSAARRGPGSRELGFENELFTVNIFGSFLLLFIPSTNPYCTSVGLSPGRWALEWEITVVLALTYPANVD